MPPQAGWRHPAAGSPLLQAPAEAPRGRNSSRGPRSCSTRSEPGVLPRPGWPGMLDILHSAALQSALQRSPPAPQQPPSSVGLSQRVYATKRCWVSADGAWWPNEERPPVACTPARSAPGGCDRLEGSAEEARPERKRGEPPNTHPECGRPPPDTDVLATVISRRGKKDPGWRPSPPWPSVRPAARM